jgi:hypothetical protein
MEKIIYKDDKIIYTPYNHGIYIKDNYDTTIRGIIFDNIKIVYLRLNDFAYSKEVNILQGIRQENIFYNNLKKCILHLKTHYKKYKIYTSDTIKKLDSDIQQDILTS